MVQIFPKFAKRLVRQKNRDGACRSFIPQKRFLYGSVALRIISPCFVDSAHLFRLRMVLNRATRRSERTWRYYWLHQFPNAPVSKKSQGSRMGKGKGGKVAWRAFLNSGAFFVETRNLRPGRARFFFNQVSKRLPFSYKMAYRRKSFITIPLSKDKPIRSRLVFI